VMTGFFSTRPPMRTDMSTDGDSLMAGPHYTRDGPESARASCTRGA
jgi:hypothetical protein